MVKTNPYFILVADSNEEALKHTLKSLSKTDWKVKVCTNGKELINIAKKDFPDLILLDVNLDKLDGIEACWELRSDPNFYKTPIVFYSERNEDYTQIAAYNAGADDFFKKPARHRLVIAKLKAIFKRFYELEQAPSIVRRFGDIEIDEDQMMVYKKGDAIKTSKKEFNLLLLLTSKPGKVFRRPNILKKIWGDDIIVGDRNIDTHIKKLRKKLGKEYIETMRGVGYRFNYKK